MIKQKIVDASFKPNNLDQVVEIEKFNEFDLLKEGVQEVWLQSQRLDSEKNRLVHLNEFLKDRYVWEFIITLLSLNVSIEEMY